MKNYVNLKVTDNEAFCIRESAVDSIKEIKETLKKENLSKDCKDFLNAGLAMYVEILDACNKALEGIYNPISIN